MRSLRALATAIGVVALAWIALVVVLKVTGFILRLVFGLVGVALLILIIAAIVRVLRERD